MNLEVRTAAASIDDADDIVALYWRCMATPERSDFVRKALADYPASVARAHGQLIGFAYTKRFAPDILELENLFVVEDQRNKRIGRTLLTQLEAAATGQYNAILLVNSDLYENPVANKRPATGFYLSNGYELIYDSGPSRIFAKNLVENRALTQLR